MRFASLSNRQITVNSKFEPSRGYCRHGNTSLAIAARHRRHIARPYRSTRAIFETLPLQTFSGHLIRHAARNIKQGAPDITFSLVKHFKRLAYRHIFNNQCCAIPYDFITAWSVEDPTDHGYRQNTSDWRYRSLVRTYACGTPG